MGLAELCCLLYEEFAPVVGVGGSRLHTVIILFLGPAGFRLHKVLGSGCLGVATLALRSNSNRVSLRIFDLLGLYNFQSAINRV